MKSDVDRAKSLLERYGGEIDDYFKFWPTGKELFFSRDNNAFLAYKVKHNVAVCPFDPIGPRNSIIQLMNEFSNYCQEHNFQIVFVQATDKYEKIYTKHDLAKVVIGCDAVIPIEEFIVRTVHNKYFRNIVNRFTKKGYKTQRYLPPHKKGLIKELKRVSDDWLKMPHHDEWQFLTGRFDEDYLNLCPIFVLRDNKGNLQAFVTELPSYKEGVGSIDLIRHRRDALPNSMDYLLIELMRQLGKDGVKDFNLGLSPLASRDIAENRTEKFVLWFYETFQSFMRFKGLHQFKAKYRPNWEPRFVYIGGGLWSLPRVGRAIIQLLGRYRPEISEEDEKTYTEVKAQSDKIA